MPETDILNATATWSADIQDSMTPDYGFTRKRPITRASQKAAGGVPYTRETQNAGHVFSFSWINRSWACVQRLKRYYEQYEDGFFTIVDHDGGGRHYVGRFTSEVTPTETANNMWSVEGVIFEEIPTVPMVEYPGDWQNDSIFVGPMNDFGDLKVAYSGSWGLLTSPAATPRQGFPAPKLNALGNPGTTPGDWLQYEYRGYGFQLMMRRGPNEGIVQIFVDGVAQTRVSGVVYVNAWDLYSPVELGKNVAYTAQNLPLDIHRVMVATTATKNSASGGIGCTWFGLQVMR